MDFTGNRSEVLAHLETLCVDAYEINDPELARRYLEMARCIDVFMETWRFDTQGFWLDASFENCFLFGQESKVSMFWSLQGNTWVINTRPPKVHTPSVH